MLNITYTVGLPVFWIRYNPDSYTTYSTKIDDDDIDERFVELDSMIKYAMENPPLNIQQYVRIKYLFYDDWDVDTISSDNIICYPILLPDSYI